MQVGTFAGDVLRFLDDESCCEDLVAGTGES